MNISTTSSNKLKFISTFISTTKKRDKIIWLTVNSSKDTEVGLGPESLLPKSVRRLTRGGGESTLCAGGADPRSLRELAGCETKISNLLNWNFSFCNMWNKNVLKMLLLIMYIFTMWLSVLVIKVCFHVTFRPCPLLSLLLNVFVLFPSESPRENGSVTHSVHYSHHQHWHNAKL